MKIRLGLFLFFYFIGQFVYGLEQIFQILPQPQSIELRKGQALQFGDLKFVVADSDGSMPVLGRIVDGLPRAKCQGKGVYLKLSALNVPDSPEGYVLEINSKGVTITARTKAGLFYGCQTLEQLLEDSRDFGKEIPTMKITDYPAIAFRAIHLDTKHHLDRMDCYYRMVDYLARFMEQPEGFISDQNHHNHLASKTNNSDWWYYYEIPMIQKVRSWINK